MLQFVKVGEDPSVQSTPPAKSVGPPVIVQLVTAGEAPLWHQTPGLSPFPERAQFVRVGESA